MAWSKSMYLRVRSNLSQMFLSLNILCPNVLVISKTPSPYLKPWSLIGIVASSSGTNLPLQIDDTLIGKRHPLLLHEIVLPTNKICTELDDIITQTSINLVSFVLPRRRKLTILHQRLLRLRTQSRSGTQPSALQSLQLSLNFVNQPWILNQMVVR